MQAEINRYILKKNYIGSHEACFAYHKGVSRQDAARLHLAKRWVIKVDLKDYFPSITEDQLRRNLLGVLNRTQINLIVNWCMLPGRRGLPQGAVTSPLLSNVAGRAMDVRMQGLATKWRRSSAGLHRRYGPISYIRYADDLVVSTNYRYGNHIIQPMMKIIKECGFVVNKDKIKILSRKNRQTVLGITVNEKMSAPRPVRKKLRSDLHRLILDCASGKVENMMFKDHDEIKPIAKPEYEVHGVDPFCKFAGKINAVRDTNPEQAAPLEKQLEIAREVHLIGREAWSHETNSYVDKYLQGYYHNV